ncbi:non-histone chromosomal protein HMG-14-like [Molossus molossus]|uniref:non-histone chromosomal protein HMG-14-like n=1 Tax=Molossus molossus TaxID=27622 RepID=UPI001746345B|nr:non-histone chromosomal protein HMG-14-like [Molossus molossus]
MEKTKISSEEGAGAEKPKRSVRMSAKPAHAKVETSQKKKKKQQKRITSDKKVQIKGKRGAKAAKQETKSLPSENEGTKNKASPASDEAGEKEGMSD